MCSDLVVNLTFSSALFGDNNRVAHQKIEFADEKIVFVTSETYNGALGGLAGADAKCQERADDAGLREHTGPGSRLAPLPFVIDLTETTTTLRLSVPMESGLQMTGQI